MRHMINPILTLVAMVVLLIVGIAGALLVRPYLADAQEKASSTRWAPYIVVLEKPATAYAPDGSTISLPAGAEIDACSQVDGSAPLFYDTASRTVHVPQPCTEPRPIFRDGFE